MSLLQKGVKPQMGEWRSRMLQTWRKSAVAQEIERLLPGLKALEDSDPSLASQKLNEANADRPGLDEQPGYDTLFSDASDDWHSMTFHIATTVGNSSTSTRSAMQDFSYSCCDKLSMVLPPRAWNLLEMYFAFTHSWFPIADKIHVLQAYYTYGRAALDIAPGSPGSGDHALLWAILTYTSVQDRAQRKTDHNTQENSAADQQLYDTARRLMPTEVPDFELGHVQGLLLLALTDLGLGRASTSWVLVGQATRYAIEIHSNLPSAASDKSSRARHVLMGCFLLDTLLSARLGRPAHMHSRYVASLGVLQEDGPEEWEPWVIPSGCVHGVVNTPSSQRLPLRSLSTFNQLIGIMHIMSDAFNTDFARPPSADAVSRTLTSLRDWENGLPPHCQLTSTSRDATDETPSSQPPYINLHLIHAALVSFFQSQERSSRSPSEFWNHDLRLSKHLWLLERYTTVVGECALPSTFEYYFMLAANYPLGIIGASAPDLNDHSVTRSLMSALDSIRRVWPGVHEVRDAHLVTEQSAQIESLRPSWAGQEEPGLLHSSVEAQVGQVIWPTTTLTTHPAIGHNWPAMSIVADPDARLSVQEPNQVLDSSVPKATPHYDKPSFHDGEYFDRESPDSRFLNRLAMYASEE
jgi:hypothetical protein